MGSKTLAELRLSVQSLYGDFEGVTAASAELDLHLKDGVNRVLERCPWVQVSNPEVIGPTALNAVGSLRMDLQSIAQVQLVELLVDGIYRTLVPVQAAFLTDPDAEIATTVNAIVGYFLDSNRVTLYPLFKDGTVTLRITYGSNSIGASFPTAVGNALPASITVPMEEAAILWAVSRLYVRDSEFEAANFIVSDFEGRLRELLINQNRPQRGSYVVAHHPDFYMLDGDPDAW